VGEGVSEFVGGAREAVSVPRAEIRSPSRQPPTHTAIRWSLTLPLTLTGTLAGLQLREYPDTPYLPTAPNLPVVISAIQRPVEDDDFGGLQLKTCR
jgi:hypothetical protein